jgi:hypothetical protein
VIMLWGRVVGATLATHPQEVWISASGAVHNGTCTPRCAYRNNIGNGAPLVAATRESLERLLPTVWPGIRGTSERLAALFGIDELRCDWLIGSDRLGPLLNEVHFHTGAALYPVVVQQALTQAFLGGYLDRLDCDAAAGCHAPPRILPDLKPKCLQGLGRRAALYQPRGDEGDCAPKELDLEAVASARRAGHARSSPLNPYTSATNQARCFVPDAKRYLPGSPASRNMSALADLLPAQHAPPTRTRPR